MSTSFKELSGSPQEFFGPQGMTAVRRLICAWNDRRALVGELLGDASAPGGGSPANYPGTPDLVAARIEVEPLAEDLVRQDFSSLIEGINAYEGFAKITVHYELLDASAAANLPQEMEAPANTFLTYATDLDDQTVRVPGDSLALPGNPTATLSAAPAFVGETPTVFPAAAMGDVILPVSIHRLAWHRVASPPWTAIRECQGMLNDGEFLGVPAGRLLFDGVKTARELLGLADGDPQLAWRLEYRFREKPLLLDSTPPLFGTADFTRLLTFEESE